MKSIPSPSSAFSGSAWQVPCALLLAFTTVLHAAPAFAQLSRVGETTRLVNTNPLPLIGNDIAFDPDDGVYLGVVAQGVVWGAFANTSGTLLFSFPIGSANRNYPFGAFPRAVYSPELNGGQGGFLITWHQPEVGSFSNVVHSAIASYPAGIVSPIRVISTNAPGVPLQGGTFANAGATIAYSPASHRFLVAWTTLQRGIQGRFLSAVTGEPIGGVMQLVDANPAGGHSHPELAWNPTTDEFGLSYSGYGGAGAFIGFKRIRASDGTASAAEEFAFSLGTFCPDIDVNPATGNYIIGWSRGAGALSVEFDRNGVRLSSPHGVLVSGRVGTPVSFSLAVNPVSGTILAVSEDNWSFEVAGVELNGSGLPLAEATAVTSGSAASWVPRVTARPDERQWNVSLVQHKVTLASQIVTTASTDVGGPAPRRCSYAISATGTSATAGAGSDSVNVTTDPADCAWTASTSASWVTLGVTSGTGAGTVTFTYAPNMTGEPRTATITIANRTFTISQARSAVRLTDFNLDSLGDILWQKGGQLAVWRMNGLTMMRGEALNAPIVADTQWRVVATADMNGDNFADLIWQHDSGYVAVWLMRQETMLAGELLIPFPVPAEWRIVAAGDLNGDRHNDLLWQHSNGTVSVWYMNRLTLRSGEVLAALTDANWRLVAATDGNLDGRLDLVWHHAATGQVAMWLMNDRTLLDGVLVDRAVSDLNWEVVGVGDFNADGNADLIWRNRADGRLQAWLMNGTRYGTGASLSPAQVPDTSWRVVGPR